MITNDFWHRGHIFQYYWGFHLKLQKPSIIVTQSTAHSIRDSSVQSGVATAGLIEAAGEIFSPEIYSVLWWSSVTHLLKGQINFCIISGAGLLALLPFNNQALISCHPKCISVQHLYDIEHFLKAVSACRFVHLVVWFRTVLKLKAVSLCVVFFKVNWDVPAICAWLRCNTESITVFLLNYYCQI